MFAVTDVPRVGERFEVRSDGANVNELGHEGLPGFGRCEVPRRTAACGDPGRKTGTKISNRGPSRQTTQTAQLCALAVRFAGPSVAVADPQRDASGQHFMVFQFLDQPLQVAHQPRPDHRRDVRGLAEAPAAREHLVRQPLRPDRQRRVAVELPPQGLAAWPSATHGSAVGRRSPGRGKYGYPRGTAASRAVPRCR